MNIRHLSMGVLITTSSVVACSPPPLDGALELQSLSDEELVQFCEDQTWEIVRLLDYQKVPIGCTLAGIAAAADAGSGEEAWAMCHEGDLACREQPDKLAVELPTPSTITSGCTTFPEAARTCKGLTVADYDSFMREERSTISGMYGARYCNFLIVSLGKGGHYETVLNMNAPSREWWYRMKEECPALLFGP